jgi:hypothetical protein
VIEPATEADFEELSEMLRICSAIVMLISRHSGLIRIVSGMLSFLAIEKIGV